MKTILRHIKKVERGAYPKAFRQLQDCRSMADLEDYCEGQPRVWTWDTGYLICTADEIVDLAAVAPVTLARLRWLLAEMAAYFGDKLVALDARAGTSWRLIQYAQRKGLLAIHHCQEWIWEGETFYELEIQFNRGN